MNVPVYSSFENSGLNLSYNILIVRILHFMRQATLSNLTRWKSGQANANIAAKLPEKYIVSYVTRSTRIYITMSVSLPAANIAKTGAPVKVLW